MAIGEIGQDNSAVEVSMSGLSFDKLPELFQVAEKASFTLSDASATDTMSFNERCQRGAIEGLTGANITLRNVQITESYAPGMSTAERSSDALIRGGGGTWCSTASSWATTGSPRP